MKNAFFSIMMMAVTALFAGSCSDGMKQSQAAETSTPSKEDLIKRGEYLVTVIGCNDCHSPKRMGPRGPEIIPELMLSGFPSESPVLKVIPEAIQGGAQTNHDFTSFAGPWGISFAANLTSDASGIGNWTEEQFRKAMTQGKYKGLDNSRMLMPPMPWTNFVSIADDDLKAMFAYLKSTPPVRNVVPQPVPPAGN